MRNVVHGTPRDQREVKGGIALAINGGESTAAPWWLYPGGGEGRKMSNTLNGDVHMKDGELGIAQCVWCRHRSDNGRRCRAFPDGIPEAILRNRHDHCQPYDGDRGIRYEPEVVEIEFIDVEEEGDLAPSGVDTRFDAGGGAEHELTAVDAEIVTVDVHEIEPEDIVFELDDVVSG